MRKAYMVRTFQINFYMLNITVEEMRMNPFEEG